MKLLAAATMAAIGLGLSQCAVGATISTSADLLTALKTAKPGSMISLEPGNYPGVGIANLTFPKPVTITSRDPNAPAVFVGLNIGNVSGLTFRNVEFTSVGSADQYFAFRVAASHHILFDHIDEHGDPAGEPSKQLMGFYFSRSSDITMTNSTFHHINVPILANNDDGVVITNNRFSYINKGGIEMGGSSNVLIARNVFTDFAVSAGTHPDVIQFYTANQHESAHDITIQDNLYFRGNGNAAMGIFMNDEAKTLPYVNVTISGNVLVGGMWNSIYVAHASGNLRVTDNTVTTWPGLDMPGNGQVNAGGIAPKITAFRAGIVLRGDMSAANIMLSGNRAQTYLGQDGRQISTPDGNDTIEAADDEGAALIQEWRTKHPDMK